jgi:hypothetical protein
MVLFRCFLFYIVLCFILFGRVEAAVKDIFPKIDAQTVVNLGQGCEFRLSVPSSASFRVSSGTEGRFGSAMIGVSDLRFFDGIWLMGLSCYHNDDENVRPGHNRMVRLDQQKKLWVKDIIARQSEAITILDQQEREAFREMLDRVEVLDIKSVNAHGWGVLYDDYFGDDKLKKRFLLFCLFYREIALCGSTEAGFLHVLDNNRSANMTPHALKLLQSIEFIGSKKE